MNRSSQVFLSLITLSLCLFITFSVQAESKDAAQDKVALEYMKKVEKSIKKEWKPARSPGDKHAKVLFTLYRDGHIADLKIVQASGDKAFDQISIEAVERAAPFARLPQKLEDKVDIEFSFDYDYEFRQRNYDAGKSAEDSDVLDLDYEKLKLKLLEQFKGESKKDIVKTNMRFALPIKGNLAEDYYAFLYPDHAKGEAVNDFACGRMSVDGNIGTTFNLKTEFQMKEGVSILAAAAGEVVKVISTYADTRSTSDEELKAMSQSDLCGNRIIIRHGKEWDSEYCHLKEGSIIVKPGDQVNKGQVIAQVGESGNTKFPGLYFIVKYKGHGIDPFVGHNDPIDCSSLAKIEIDDSLWEENIPYRGTGFVRAGFADRSPDIEDSVSGRYPPGQTLSKDADALMLWSHVYGLLANDEERFVIYRPDGSIFVEDSWLREEPLRASIYSLGRRNSSPPFMTGEWRGEYQLIRNKKVLVDTKQVVTVQ